LKMIIHLRRQWPYIEGVARARLANNKTSRHVSEYGDQIEVVGAAGELAARICFGLPADLGTHFDGGTDFIYHGMRIDVKATQWTRRIQFRFLQWPLWKPIKADVILLTAIDDDDKNALLVGYATRTEIALAQINTSRDDPCHEIAVQNLHPIRELMPPAPKNKRFADPDFHKKIIGRDGVCLYGLHEREDCSGGLDPHHIKTRGSGGGDTLENGITLCRRHHNLAQSNVIPSSKLRAILSEYYGYHY
jgi:hypothetical protein